MPDISRIVHEVLSQIGSHREARYYFELFNDDDPLRFALIAIDNSIAKNSGEQLSSAIGLLYHLGLLPVLLHSNETDQNEIAANLEGDDVSINSISGNILQSPIDLKSIELAINHREVPVICGLDVNEDSLADALIELSKLIRPHKIILLSQQGGLVDDDGRIVSSFNLNSSIDQINSASFKTSDSLLTLVQARELLQSMPTETSISVTSVQNLVKELFTYKGAGTLIRLEEKVEMRSEFDSELKTKLANLIQASFDRELKPEYFEAIDLDKLFISESATAIAVVLKNDKGLPYLDKFIVTPQAQGIGLGKVIWKKLNQEYKQLYWRARINNPINNWYLRQADSTKRQGEWIVFGQNIAAEDWSDCVEDALSRTVYMVNN